MITVTEIIEKLADRNLREVARRADVPYGSLLYFFKNDGGLRVDIKMVEKLSDYLEGKKENG